MYEQHCLTQTSSRWRTIGRVRSLFALLFAAPTALTFRQSAPGDFQRKNGSNILLPQSGSTEQTIVTHTTIESFHIQIVQWRQEGKSLRDIANSLQELGLDIDHNAVGRYCAKAEISFTPPFAAPPTNSKSVLARGHEQIRSQPSGGEPMEPAAAEKEPTPTPNDTTRTHANTSCSLGVRVSSTSDQTGQISTAGPVFSTAAPFPILSHMETPTPPPVQDGQPFRFTAPIALPSTPALQPTPPPVQKVPPVRAIAPLAPPPLLSLRKPSKRMTDFPELHAVAQHIVWFASVGFTLPKIHSILTEQVGIQTTIEEISEYMDAAFWEFNPPGQVLPSMYSVKGSDGRWPDETGIYGFENSKNADVWKIGDFFEGTLILGASGSGKTTGSARNLARTFLKAQFGGLILTTKPGEADEWAKLITAMDRTTDISIVRVGGYLRLDVLAYESQRPGQAGRLSENLLHFFKNLLSVLSAKRGHVTNAAFWQSTGDQLLRNLLTVYLAAKFPLTIDGLAQFLTNAPLSAAEAHDNLWRQIPVFGPCLSEAERNATTPEAHRTLTILKEYWLHYYPTLASDTRSCIAIGFAAMVDALRSPEIHKLIAAQTTITPELIFDGHIVIVDLPINDFHEAGLLVQTAWKYLFQRAVLNRPDKSWGQRCRPVFLWEDECQNFLIDYDSEFNRVARDCRVARVMITQNINNLYDAFGGGDHARVKVESILGTLNTRIFHANGDLATNKWASESIGTFDKKTTETTTTPPQYHGLNPVKDMLFKMIKRPTVATTTHTKREPHVHPHEFSQLRPGGPANGMVTEAFITQVGRRFDSGNPYSKIAFKQLTVPSTDQTVEELKAALNP
jgi:hypothetical protein